MIFFENKKLIFLILFVFHLDISGKEIKDEHPENIPLISSILLVFHFDKSGNEIKEEHPANE